MEIIVTLWLSFNGLDSNKLFEISYDCAPENVRAGKSLGKILYLFSNIFSMIRGRTWGT